MVLSQARIKAENTALLSEKTSWTMSNASPEDSQRAWEAEKAELVKAKEEASALAKVSP